MLFQSQKSKQIFTSWAFFSVYSKSASQHKVLHYCTTFIKDKQATTLHL